jgi:hypothetical protein
MVGNALNMLKRKACNGLVHQAVMLAPSRALFQVSKPCNGVLMPCCTVIFATHFNCRLQAGTHGGSIWLIKDHATVVHAELYTAHSCGFAMRHTWNWRGNRWCDAACTATRPALHEGPFAKRELLKPYLQQHPLNSPLLGRFNVVRHPVFTEYMLGNLDDNVVCLRARVVVKAREALQAAWA